MRYLGIFTNINNEIFSITIYTNGNTPENIIFSYPYNECEIDYNTDVEEWANASQNNSALLLSDNPVTIIRNNGADIFNSISPLSCTIEILMTSLVQDLYTSTFNNYVMVRNETTNKRLFYGYITPNIYTQPYDTKYSTIQIECISPISALQYKQVTNKGLWTLKDILKTCIGTNYYYIYLHDVYKFKDSEDNIASTLNDIYLDLRNCYDGEDGESWTQYDLLEQTIKMLGLTLKEGGDSIYIFDNSQWQTNSNYYQIDLSNNNVYNSTISFSGYDVTNIKNLADSTTLSMDESYNRVSVLANTYPINNDNLFYDGAVKFLYTSSDWEYMTNKDSYFWRKTDSDGDFEQERYGLEFDNNSNYENGDLIWYDNLVLRHLNPNGTVLPHISGVYPMRIVAGFYECPNVTRNIYYGDTKVTGGLHGNINLNKYTTAPSNFDTLPTLYNSGRYIIDNEQYSTLPVGAHTLKYILQNDLQKEDKARWFIIIHGNADGMRINVETEPTRATVEAPDGSADQNNNTSLTTVYQAAHAQQMLWLYNYEYPYYANMSENQFLHLNFTAIYNARENNIYGDVLCPFEVLNVTNNGTDPINYILGYINIQINLGHWYLIGSGANTLNYDVIDVGKKATNVNYRHSYAYIFKNNHNDVLLEDYQWIYLPTDADVDAFATNNGDCYPCIRLYYTKEDSGYYAKELKLESNIKPEYKDVDNGVVIKLPNHVSISYANNTMVGVGFYRPNILNNVSKNNHIIIKDFETKIIVLSEIGTVDEIEVDGDNLYYNLPTETNVIKKDDWEIKYNTQDEEKLESYSSVLVANRQSGRFEFLQKVWHALLDKYTLLEYHLIKLFHEHFKNPKIIYETTINGYATPETYITTSVTNDNMLIDEMEYNAQQNTSKIKARQF